MPAGTPVILISIDTLRSDRLPAYGYRGVATPAIDRLRRDGILFERAWAPAPLTLPSHASLLTGLSPDQHRVRDNIGYRLPGSGGKHLPQLLKELGYATGAAVSSYVVRGETGLAAGFERYDDELPTAQGELAVSAWRPGRQTVARALDWTRSVAGRPFFLFVHLFEPHLPYEPPEPFASRYPSRYDGEIAAADQAVGELVAELERLGVYDRALVILLSDHGEGLGEHGEQEHGILLYR
ncbi:MAG TPA: sulfatase, partial [Thermoanaerobaculia bacterium]|nr:sulfatase [Thermoanaerobaculia bacterium]